MNQLSQILRTAWARFNIIGKANGDYVARALVFLMYFTVLVPFALIAQFLVDPLEIRRAAQPHWRARKAISASLDEARSQS